MRTCLLLLLAAWCIVATVAAPVRCFVRNYDMVAANEQRTMYTASIDVLTEAPVMLSFDMALSRVTDNLCPHSDGTGSDALRFVWSDNPNYTAPFTVLPVRCGERSALEFGLSTLGPRHWGDTPRRVTDGSRFLPQNWRASMMLGTHVQSQMPERMRTLSVRMTSSRNFTKALTVRSCIYAELMPYDMPEDAQEVEPPRLIPIAACIRESGGHCSTQLGYINTLDEAIELPYGKRTNRLKPDSSGSNGYEMPSVFEPGVHAPSSFDPEMRVAWFCNGVDDPPEAHWLLDETVLYYAARSFMCGNALQMQQSLAIEAYMQAMEEQLVLQGFQDTDPYLVTTSKAAPTTPKTLDKISGVDAQFYWAKNGVTEPYMSTLVRDAHIAAEAYARSLATAESVVRPSSFDEHVDFGKK